MAKDAAAAAMGKNVNDDGVRNPAAKASEAIKKRRCRTSKSGASCSLGAPTQALAA